VKRVHVTHPTSTRPGNHNRANRLWVRRPGALGRSGVRFDPGPQACSIARMATAHSSALGFASSARG
jgi:hypothetical protein